MTCKNCNTPILAEQNYCPECGAKVIRNRLTLKNLFQNFTETFFNYDNKILQTIISLLKTPEQVIDSYVNGVRKRFINPVSFFGISLTLAGFNIFIIKKFFKKYMDATSLFQNNKMQSNEFSQEIMEFSTDFSLEYSSLIYASMIPIFALMSWVIFLNKKYNYTEHLVTYMYSMSLYSITSVAFGLLVMLISPHSYLAFGMSLYVVALFYHCFLLKRLFDLSYKELILKTFLFLVMFLFAYTLFSLLVGIIMVITMYLNGNLQEIFEAQKAAAGK